jgi:hypothetical protein
LIDGEYDEPVTNAADDDENDDEWISLCGTCR